MTRKIDARGLTEPLPQKPAPAPRQKILKNEASGHPLNDVGNARRLKDLHGADMRYVPELKAWFGWDGRVWVDSPAQVNVWAVEVCNALRKEASKLKDPKAAERLRRFATTTGNDGKITAMLRQAAALPELNKPLKEFDTAGPPCLSIMTLKP
jgi:hypothetical protein